jgi:hypothetical protein
MNIGMLWFDNDTKSDLPAKVNRAATYYIGKYGKKPNICFVHPSMAQANSNDKALKAGDIEIQLTKTVLPHHFWIGIQTVNGNTVT